MEIKYLNQEHSTSVNIRGSVVFLSYKALDEISWLQNAFSTREGGLSDGYLASMNLNYNVGDDRERVTENFRRFGSAVGLDCENMVFSHQTHTTNVLCVGREHMGMGILRERSFHDVDGLVTNVPGVCLVTSYADCVPLYFVDREKRAIGLSHSGWRGTVGNIAKETCKVMQKEYGTRVENLLVCIGPSICQSCYEVGQDVAAQFETAYDGDECGQLLQPKGAGKYLLNLHLACRFHFLHLGIREENIIMPDICTCCNQKLLFSHRASQGKRGGLCAFLAIK